MSYYPPCPCGEPATTAIYLEYRYPREHFTPIAMDPWYVHGCWPARTCGSPACEAEAYMSLLAVHPDADVMIRTEADEDTHVYLVADDEDDSEEIFADGDE